jgi:hypothetical protein
MTQLLLEGYTIDEILKLPKETLDSIVLSDETIVFKAGTANILGKFKIQNNRLLMELAHIDGGGEGALPSLAALASRYAKRENLEYIEWRVHAIHCAKPNLKLRSLLEKRGFVIRDVDGVGECYWLQVSTINT